MKPVEHLTIHERFRAFHAAHPDVYALFERFALELYRAGREHYGAKAIMERVRWHYATTSTGQEFKINNNFTAHYARMFCTFHPHLGEFFRFRQLRSV